MKKYKVSHKFPDEIKYAIATVVGASNLAFDEEIRRIFTKLLDGSKELTPELIVTGARRCENYMGQQCESDEMYEGMLDECRSWKKSSMNELTWHMESILKGLI
jgi:hypothetical protein